MFILEKYTKQSFEANEEYLSNALNNIKEIVDFYFEDKPSFSSKDYELYYLDESALGTQTNNIRKFNIYLELNPINNIKLHQRKIRNRDKNVLDMYLTLETIREDLKELFVNTFNSNVFIGMKDKSVLIREVTLDEYNNKQMEVYIELIPCFTHLDENDNACIVFYNKKQKDITIKYTKIILKNFKYKNKSTDGLLTDYILLFKNIYQEKNLVKDLPFEIVETLLYNVPDSMFIDLSIKTLLNIINYLRNKNLPEFVSIDNNQFAFVSKYSNLSYYYAKNFLKQTEKAIKNLM